MGRPRLGSGERSHVDSPCCDPSLMVRKAHSTPPLGALNCPAIYYQDILGVLLDHGEIKPPTVSGYLSRGLPTQAVISYWTRKDETPVACMACSLGTRVENVVEPGFLKPSAWRERSRVSLRPGRVGSKDPGDRAAPRARRAPGQEAWDARPPHSRRTAGLSSAGGRTRAGSRGSACEGAVYPCPMKTRSAGEGFRAGWASCIGPCVPSWGARC